jgi:ABC-2 type transport system ATP-binding protein
VIEAVSLTKRYGTREAVHDVSFAVGAGEIVGLLGPNGAGKTTIMKILTCSLFPTQGTARVDGHDVLDDPLKVKASVGYLPENAPLYPDLTVQEYLGFVAQARGLGKANRAEAIDRVCTACGLSAVMHRGIGELSKGYRQRAGLAQAMVHDPRILILDEPTTGLDPHQIVEIRDLIRSLGREKTVILSSHILQEVEATCQRVLILNEGKIVAQGTREEMERGLKGEVLMELTLKPPAGTDAVGAALSALAGIARVIDEKRDSAGRLVVQLSLSPDSGAEEALFDWAVAAGMKILSMVPRRLSLEDIFISLTEQGAGR